MNKEQEDEAKKFIKRTVAHIARSLHVYQDDIERVIKEEYTEEDDFTVVCWPDIQYLMDKEDFHLNASLANDEWSLEKYGSSAYFVNKKWLYSLNDKGM